MKTIQLSEHEEITISAFKDRETDIMKIKIRINNTETLEKRGIVLDLPFEFLQRMERVLPGKNYPSINLLSLIEK